MLEGHNVRYFGDSEVDPHAKTPVLSQPAQEVSGSILTLWPTYVGLPQTDRETDMPV